MFMHCNPYEDRRGCGPRGGCDPFDRWEDGLDGAPFGREPLNGGCGRGPRGGCDTPFGPEGRHCGPRGFGPGFPPHGAPPFGGPGFPPHGMPPHGGRPPRRPDPTFLRRRLEEADLAELIAMTGRMLHRRPRGGPAQGQALILSILAGREALSQRELQQMLGIQPGSLSELVGKLEAKGLLTREKAEDRRGNVLRITNAGRAALPDTANTPEDDLFAPLTPEQQDALADMLRALLGRWIDELPFDAGAPGGQKPVQV